MKHNVYRIFYKARIQHGVWHAEDDLEITGYGQFKEQQFLVAACDEVYVRAWWAKTIRHWPKEYETELLNIENLGGLTIIDVR
jgi:hypothetical protein